jgi:hypothetical protein
MQEVVNESPEIILVPEVQPDETPDSMVTQFFFAFIS